MQNTTTQSAPNNRCTNYTNLSLTLHPNTTLNRKQSILSNHRYQRKTSLLELYETKNYVSIIENANNQLQQYLFNLNEHIKKVIQKRQANYYTAFENHVGFVQRQLKMIKQTYQQSKMYEKTISLEQVILRLERQCEIFRHQALRYFQLLQQRQQQLKITKRQAMDLRQQLEISQFTKKKLMSRYKVNNRSKVLAGQQEDYVAFQQSVRQEYNKNSCHKKMCQNSQMSRLSKSNKQERQEESRLQTLSSLIKKTNEQKFRQTLMEFDLKKKSNEYFYKHPVSARKTTTRSFLTYMTRNKVDDISGDNMNGNRNKNERNFDNNDIKKIFQRFHSQSKLNNFLAMQQQQKLQKQKIYEQYEQLRISLKDIITTRVKQMSQPSWVIRSQQSQQKFIFNFNSDQSIGDFIEFLFPKMKIKNQQTQLKQINCEDFLLQESNKKLTHYQEQQKDQQFPFELISTSSKQKRLKTENNLICSTIYSVEKGQRFQNCSKQKKDTKPLLYSTKHKIIAISKKKSTLKNNKFTAQWADLKINKKINYQDQLK